jgi:anti-anti-sigma factor
MDQSSRMLNIVAANDPGHFRLEGELDLNNADELAELIEREMSEGRQVVLNLSNLSFMDSSGIRTLIRVSKFGRERQAPPLVLESLSAPVQQLLSVALPSGIPGVEFR